MNSKGRPGPSSMEDEDRPVVLIGRPRPAHGTQPSTVVMTRRWHTVAEVAAMLGFGLSKTKMLVATGQLRSLKDGKHRRILPEWVDEYVARRAREWAA